MSARTAYIKRGTYFYVLRKHPKDAIPVEEMGFYTVPDDYMPFPEIKSEISEAHKDTDGVYSCLVAFSSMGDSVVIKESEENS